MSFQIIYLLSVFCRTFLNRKTIWIFCFIYEYFHFHFTASEFCTVPEYHNPMTLACIYVFPYFMIVDVWVLTDWCKTKRIRFCETKAILRMRIKLFRRGIGSHPSSSKFAFNLRSERVKRNLIRSKFEITDHET